MGREVKRVALDFDWPIKKIWEGYVNHHYKQCDGCNGDGSTSASRRLEELVRLILLSGSDAYGKRPHPYFINMDSLHYTQGTVVSPDMIELTDGLSDRKVESEIFGYEGSAAFRATRKIIEAAGLDSDKWGVCKECKGEGVDPSVREAYEAWVSQCPPDGTGWQMWENTTEGSPISPVFKTPEDLASWLAETKASSFGGDTATYEQWLRMIQGPGWAPSAVCDDKGFRSGVEAIADIFKDD